MALGNILCCRTKRLTSNSVILCIGRGSRSGLELGLRDKIPATGVALSGAPDIMIHCVDSHNV